MKSRRHVLTAGPLVSLLLAWALLAGGCALTQVTFREDDRITELFESAAILPGHDYYYSGPEAEPLAIVAIRPGYTFVQGLWHKIDLNERQMQDWLWVINNETRGVRYRYRGARILAPDGSEVGVWFSFLDWVVAEVTPDRQVILHIPDNTIIPRMRRQGGAFP